MIPRNAEIFVQNPDDPLGPNIRLEGEALAQWWADWDARQEDMANLVALKVPRSISDRQFFQQLALNGTISEANAEAAVAAGEIPPAMLGLIDQLPVDQRFGARMMLKGATVFERGHQLTATLAALFGWSNEQVDDLFRAAAAL